MRNEQEEEKEEILTYEMLENMLWDLADSMNTCDMPLDIVVTGGGALILCYEFSFSTTDIDGFNRYWGNLSDTFVGTIEQVADSYRIQSNWLNDHMFECIEPDDYYDYNFMINNLDMQYAKEYYSQNGNLAFRFIPVSLEGILISKLEAGRSKDFPHMQAICEELGFTTEEEIVDMLYDYFNTPRNCMLVNAKTLAGWL